MRAISVATRPRIFPPASTTYQRCSISPALTEYVFILLFSRPKRGPVPARCRRVLEFRTKIPPPAHTRGGAAWSGQTGTIHKSRTRVNRPRRGNSRRYGARTGGAVDRPRRCNRSLAAPAGPRPPGPRPARSSRRGGELQLQTASRFARTPHPRPLSRKLRGRGV